MSQVGPFYVTLKTATELFSKLHHVFSTFGDLIQRGFVHLPQPFLIEFGQVQPEAHGIIAVDAPIGSAQCDLGSEPRWMGISMGYPWEIPRKVGLHVLNIREEIVCQHVFITKSNRSLKRKDT